MTANNVTRFLQTRKIPFEVFEIPGGKRSAQETANLLNVPVGRVFKTIVLQPVNPGKPILAIVPADKTADLKLIAKFLNEKKLEFPTPQEAEQLTGLQTGGISALALINKGFRILLDNSATELDWMHVSGGQRGINIKLLVKDFIKITNARIASISSRLGEKE
ncbi:MAG: Cys-tRNA(Pro) deacylase [Anaerolineaceae bacterium]|nr:Cys-tRNA(Pro) deacylase [Anaerolineaceae bacterium]